MKSILPKTNYLIFNVKNSPKIDWHDYIEGHFDPPIHITNYNEACYGDSGSGQFTKSLDGLRYLLVAIYKGRISESFRDANGKKHNYPCGTFTWNKGFYRHNHKVSESTTWHENLEWIKKKANILRPSSVPSTNLGINVHYQNIL